MGGIGILAVGVPCVVKLRVKIVAELATDGGYHRPTDEDTANDYEGREPHT